MNQLNYGGQAVMEGVMMRGSREWAVCVRAPSGEIISHRDTLPPTLYRSRLFKLPLLRGLVVLWDSLGIGLRALIWSADIAAGDEQEVQFSGGLAWTTVAVSLLLGTGLFVLLPALITSLFDPYLTSPALSNLVEGFIRLLFFLAYLWLIGRLPDIQRVFAYHGAEHKTINAYEAGATLEPEAIARFSRVHTRCGTGFLLIVLFVFVLLSTLIGRPPILLRLLSRILLIPFVTGISYEFVKLASRYHDRSILARALLAPGLALQKLTTREPEPAMLEVSLCALRQVLQSEGLVQEGTNQP